jgi:hypothetical protein
MRVQEISLKMSAWRFHSIRATQLRGKETRGSGEGIQEASTDTHLTGMYNPLSERWPRAMAGSIAGRVLLTRHRKRLSVQPVAHQEGAEPVVVAAAGLDAAAEGGPRAPTRPAGHPPPRPSVRRRDVDELAALGELVDLGAPEEALVVGPEGRGGGIIVYRPLRTPGLFRHVEGAAEETGGAQHVGRLRGSLATRC